MKEYGGIQETGARPPTIVISIQFQALYHTGICRIMNRYSEISLIDNNSRRRASRGGLLSYGRFKVYDFGSIDDFIDHGNQQSLILVYDNGSDMDLLLSDMNQRSYWSPVVAYGDLRSPVSISKALLDGIVGYLHSTFILKEFENLLEERANQITKMIDLRQGSADARRKLSLLTRRELEILDHLQFGLSSRDIAEKFEISRRTIEAHRANINHKLDVNNTLSSVKLKILATMVC